MPLQRVLLFPSSACDPKHQFTLARNIYTSERSTETFSPNVQRKPRVNTHSRQKLTGFRTRPVKALWRCSTSAQTQYIACLSKPPENSSNAYSTISTLTLPTVVCAGSDSICSVTIVRAPKKEHPVAEGNCTMDDCVFHRGMQTKKKRRVRARVVQVVCLGRGQAHTHRQSNTTS